MEQPKPKLWRTTITILSPFCGDAVELSDLARDAEQGESYCLGYASEPMADAEIKALSSDVREFFACELEGDHA